MRRLTGSVAFIGIVTACAACEGKKEAPATASTVSATGTAAASASARPAAPALSASAAPSGSGSASPASSAATPDFVTAQHVLVAYKGAKGAGGNVVRSKADAKKRAEEVEAKAKAGEEFSTLAEQYSDDKDSKERLGSVGKFTRKQMTKTFSDAAFDLKVGDVSGVVESPHGFHVIKRNQ